MNHETILHMMGKQPMNGSTMAGNGGVDLRLLLADRIAEANARECAAMMTAGTNYPSWAVLALVGGTMDGANPGQMGKAAAIEALSMYRSMQD